MTTAQPARRVRSPRSSASKNAKTVATPSTSVHEPPVQEIAKPAGLPFDFSKPPGYYDATAKVALLRRSKQAPHDEVLIDFAREAVRIELRAASCPLVIGNWEWQATAAGKSLVPAGEWTQVSWHRDKACDFLQIDLPLSDGYRLERQVFLSREDLVLFATDCLIGPAGGEATELRHTQVLPLASEASFVAAAETREGWLSLGGRRRASVIPLSQTEWRSDFCHASIATQNNQLIVEQAVQGRNLLSPLWIDLNSSRLKRPLTWRRLTVGEHLTGLARDVATGYRVQVGDEQWMIYRSLDRVGNRSVLGHNTCGSFVCARILADAVVKPILTMD